MHPSTLPFLRSQQLFILKPDVDPPETNEGQVPSSTWPSLGDSSRATASLVARKGTVLAEWEIGDDPQAANGAIQKRY